MPESSEWASQRRYGEALTGAIGREPFTPMSAIYAPPPTAAAVGESADGQRSASQQFCSASEADDLDGEFDQGSGAPYERLCLGRSDQRGAVLDFALGGYQLA